MESKIKMKAVVLAGGKSSRMGQDKASMNLNGKALMQYVMDNLSSVFDEVFISGNQSNYPISKGVIKDIVIEKGPMGGICSALEFCGEDIFVCSCDMPFVSSELIYDIFQRRKENIINILRYNGKVYPVLGIYPFSVLNAIKESIEDGNLKMIDFLKIQNAHYIDFNDGLEQQLLNINTPEDFLHVKNIINKIIRQ